MNIFYLIMFSTTIFTAFSQVLLKQSAGMKHKSFIFEYLNWRVMTAYFIMFAVLFANTYAFTGVEMKYGAVIDAFSYVFVMLFSWILLKEKFTRGQLAGNLLIIAGILIYTI